MSNYLKKFLFAALIFIMPYMNSVSKAMDDGDREGSSVRTSKVSLMTDDQQDVSSSVKQSTSSQLESLEDSKVSWASYLISPVKATFQTANEFINLATCNPKLAVVVGMHYILPTISASCLCLVQNQNPFNKMCDGGIYSRGCRLTEQECIKSIVGWGLCFINCTEKCGGR